LTVERHLFLAEHRFSLAQDRLSLAEHRFSLTVDCFLLVEHRFRLAQRRLSSTKRLSSFAELHLF
jgi:hypothetical protein